MEGPTPLWGLRNRECTCTLKNMMMTMTMIMMMMMMMNQYPTPPSLFPHPLQTPLNTHLRLTSFDTPTTCYFIVLYLALAFSTYIYCLLYTTLYFTTVIVSVGDPTMPKALFVWIYTTRAWRWISRVETCSPAFTLYIICYWHLVLLCLTDLRPIIL